MLSTSPCGRADRGAVVREIGWPDKFAALAEAQRIVQVFETARAFAIEFEQNRDQLSPPLVALIEEGQSIGTETYLTALRTGANAQGRSTSCSVQPISCSRRARLERRRAACTVPVIRNSTVRGICWARRRSMCRCRVFCVEVNRSCHWACR